MVGLPENPVVHAGASKSWDRRPSLTFSSALIPRPRFPSQSNCNEVAVPALRTAPSLGRGHETGTSIAYLYGGSENVGARGGAQFVHYQLAARRHVARFGKRLPPQRPYTRDMRTSHACPAERPQAAPRAGRYDAHSGATYLRENVRERSHLEQIAGALQRAHGYDALGRGRQRCGDLEVGIDLGLALVAGSRDDDGSCPKAALALIICISASNILRFAEKATACEDQARQASAGDELFIGMKMTFGEPLTSASFAGAFSKPLSSSLRPI
jgi:hypothetical protein